MDLNSILSALTSNNTVNQIGKQFNIDGNQVSSIISSALPTLIGAMQRNASTENGASSLAQAMTDHIGDSVINVNNLNISDGNKILGHILGGNSSSVISALAQKTGSDNSQVSNILASIAPTLLGLLGKGKQSTNTSNSGLGSMLGGLLGGSSSNGMGGILGAALADKDGDGTPDILGGLGSLFK